MTIYPGDFAPDEPSGPEERYARELRALLLEQRTVLVRGVLDDVLAGRAAAEIMTLDATADREIRVHLDCSGGSLDAAFTLMDTIDLCGVRVSVTVVGRVEGPGVGVLAVGHERLATEHARVRLADPEIDVTGPTSSLAEQVRAATERLATFHDRLAAATRRPLEQIVADCRRGRYLSAEEALDYGLVDAIARRGGTVHPFPRRFGFRP